MRAGLARLRQDVRATSAALASEDSRSALIAITGIRKPLGVGDEILHLRLLAGPRQRQDDVVGGDHAEVAVARFRGMDEKRRGAGRGERRRDLAADMAGLAEPGDDQPAPGIFDQVGGRDEGRPQIGLQRRRDRGDAAALRIPACAVADWMAASAWSVPDDFAISGFGLAMSASREKGPTAPGPLHSTARAVMRRAPSRSQRLINHNCFNSINDVFRGIRGSSIKYLTLLGYFSS